MTTSKASSFRCRRCGRRRCRFDSEETVFVLSLASFACGMASLVVDPILPSFLDSRPAAAPLFTTGTPNTDGPSRACCSMSFFTSLHHRESSRELEKARTESTFCCLRLSIQRSDWSNLLVGNLRFAIAEKSRFASLSRSTQKKMTLVIMIRIRLFRQAPTPPHRSTQSNTNNQSIDPHSLFLSALCLLVCPHDNIWLMNVRTLPTLISY